MALTISSIATVHHRLGEAAAAQAAWGASRTVAIVVSPIAAGDPVAEQVRLEDRPVAMVPTHAVDSTPAGARAAVDLVPGEILLASRLVMTAGSSLPDGTLALTVSVDGEATLVGPGDLVDLWSTDLSTLMAERVATAVVVLERREDALTVAVPEDSVGRLAVAALRPLTVALRGAGV